MWVQLGDHPMETEFCEGVGQHRFGRLGGVSLPLEVRMEGPADLRGEVVDARQLEIEMTDDSPGLEPRCRELEGQLQVVAHLGEPLHPRPLGDLLRHGFPRARFMQQVATDLRVRHVAMNVVHVA